MEYINKKVIRTFDAMESKLGTYRVVFILGFLVGLASFLYLWGPSALNIFYLDWRLGIAGNDPFFTEIAIQKFLAEPWSFPLGTINGIFYPENTSIVYVDGIPLVAIIAKLFYPLIGRPFQYAGIYGVVCFGLQGGFAAILLKKYTDKKLHILICTLFITFAFPMVLKMCGHTSMVAQFPILAALCLWLYHKERYVEKREVLFWTIILVISATTNAYLVPMIMALMAGYILSVCIHNHRIFYGRFLKLLTISIATTLVVMWIEGSFVSEVTLNGISGEGYALGSFNLNSFYNPMFSDGSQIFKSIPVRIFQNEGYAWLGAGMIVIFILFVLSSIQKKEAIQRRELIQKIPFLCVAAILLLFATSNIVTLNENVLFTIPLPYHLLNILGIFRTSGRFVWPVYYMIYIFLLGYLLSRIEISYKRKTVVLLLLCLFQIWDMQGLPKGSTVAVSNAGTSTFNSAFWDDMGTAYNHLDELPLGGRNSMGTWGELCKKAFENDMSVNFYQVARAPKEMVNNSYAMMEQIKAGTLESDHLVVINEMSAISAADLSNREVYQIDGQFVLTEKEALDMSCYSEANKLGVKFQTLNEYLEYLWEAKSNSLIVITNKADCSAIFNEQTLAEFQKLGLATNLTGAVQKSYGVVFVPEQKQPVYEGLSDTRLEGTVTVASFNVHIISDGPGGAGNSTQINGVEYSSQTRGWNICVFNNTTGEIEEVASFDPYDGGDAADGVILTYQS